MQAQAQLSNRAQKKEETRQALRDAAITLFQEKGLMATQISDITNYANVAHGTFYVHFKSKEEILDLELENFNHSLVLRFMELWQQEGNLDNGPTMIKNLIEIYFSHLENNKQVVSCISEKILSSLKITDIRDGINPPMVEYLLDLFNNMALKLKHPTDSIPYLVHGLLSMWLRLSLQAIFNPKANIARVKETLCQMTMASIEAVLPGALKINLSL